MSLIQWSDAYSVGIAKFDSQHKQLVAQVNELHAAMAAGQANQALGDILNRLVAYTDTHFVDEEVAMTKFNVPGLAVHKDEHQKLRSQVVKFAGDFSAGRAAMSIEILLFLKSWLVQHMQKSDKNYGPHLKGKTL
jgi:hemerythrin